MPSCVPAKSVLFLTSFCVDIVNFHCACQAYAQNFLDYSRFHYIYLVNNSDRYSFCTSINDTWYQLHKYISVIKIQIDTGVIRNWQLTIWYGCQVIHLYYKTKPGGIWINHTLVWKVPSAKMTICKSDPTFCDGYTMDEVGMDTICTLWNIKHQLEAISRE